MHYKPKGINKMKYVDVLRAANLENITVQAMGKRIQSNNYSIKKVDCQGGKQGQKILIRLEDLSPKAQDRYWREEIQNKKEPEETGFLLGLDPYQIREYNRRVEMMEIAITLPRPGLGRKEKMVNLAEEFGITYMHLTRIVNIYNKEGLRGLVPKKKKREGSKTVTPEIQEKVISLFFYEGKPYMTQVFQAIKLYCKEKEIKCPKYPAVNRFIKQYEKKNPQDAYAHRFGIQATRQKFGVYIPRDFTYLVPNDLWMGDHSPLDILVINPISKKPDRPWITAFIDVRTRVIMGYHISFQPSSWTIALALKQGIYRKQYFGIPKMVYIDNGKDFRAKMFGGKLRQFGAIDFNEETKCFFSTLNISATYALPYNARAKAQIERFFGTLERGWINIQPGYTGHNVKNRPEKLEREIKEGKLLSFIKLKELIADAILAYHGRPHRSLNRKAPLELFAELWDREDRIDMRGLEYLLMKKDERVIQRDGIHINNLSYFTWDPEFAACIGKKAVVRHDPDDLRWINVSVGDKHFGEIYTAEAARWGDKEAMKRGMQLQKTQEKRWRRNIQKTDEENTEIRRLLTEGVHAEQVETVIERPAQMTVHHTGLEQKADEEEIRKVRKIRDMKPKVKKPFRFKQGVI